MGAQMPFRKFGRRNARSIGITVAILAAVAVYVLIVIGMPECKPGDKEITVGGMRVAGCPR